MKKVVLSLVLVALLAGTANAYVQVGHLTPVRDDAKVGDQQKGSTAGAEVAWQGTIEPVNGSGGQPTAPVPEPGTMALASLGLLAIGAARKRRHQSNK